MIDNVTFMGREECLTKPAKKAVSAAHEYLSPSAVLLEAPSKAKAAEPFFGECSPVNENTFKTQVVKAEDIAADKLAQAYKAAHGIM